MADNRPDNDENNGARKSQDTLLGLFLVVMPIAIFVLIVGVWPKVVKGADGVVALKPGLSWFDGLSSEALLMVIVLLCGALGSAIHAARSYGYFHGEGAFSTNWFAWYWLRLPVGMGLALVVYLALRGGLFAGNFANDKAATDTINPFGFAALAALIPACAKADSRWGIPESAEL